MDENGQGPGVVVFSAYTNALNAVRSLGMHGVRVAVVSTTQWDFAQYSKYCSEHEPLPQIRENCDNILELLERKAKDWRGWALLPACDHSLEALSRHHERLSKDYRVLAAPEPITSLMLDKDRFRELAERVGVEMPRYYGLATPELGTRTDLQFPLIIKPTMTHKFLTAFKKKLLVVKSREELIDALARIDQIGVACQVFDLVPGPDSQLYSYGVYIDRHGEPTGGIVMRKLRQAPPFYGVSRVIETVHREDLHPILREPTLEILRRAGYRAGSACAEYKLDPRDGRMKLLEINVRMDLTFGLARAAGVNFAHLMWQDQVLEERVQAAPSGWQGVWIHLLSDIKHSFRHFRRESLTIRDYVSPYLRRKVFGVLSLSDPLPFIMQTREAFASIGGTIKRVVRGEGFRRQPASPQPTPPMAVPSRQRSMSDEADDADDAMPKDMVAEAGDSPLTSLSPQQVLRQSTGRTASAATKLPVR